MRLSRVSFDLYVNNSFVKRMTDNTTIGWAELQGLANAEGYKQAVRDEGYKLFKNGALSIKNVEINVSYMMDRDYQTAIEKEITGGGMSAGKSQSRTSNDKVTEVGLSMPSGSSSTNESTTTGLSPTTSRNDPLANYTPNTAYSGASTKEQVYTQAAVAVVGNLVDEMNANYEKKQARLESEKKASEAVLERKYEAKFRAVFLPLMKKAKAGDENARMTLYFASNKIELMDYVPDRWRWLEEAVNNNNTDALLEKAERIFTSMMYKSKSKGTEEDFNSYIAKATELGSAEALLRLAFYNAFIVPNSTSDTKKALELYTKVAAQGNPIAMYNLGMIYKYGYLEETNKYNKQYYAKFDISLDENKAIEWFLKCYETLSNDTYQESLFSRSKLSGESNVFGSFIINGYSVSEQCLWELSKVYKEGKTVPKDKKKANEYKNMVYSLKTFVRKQKLYNIDGY